MLELQDASMADHEIAQVTFEGKCVKMAIQNRDDLVQAQHRWGRFYELNQLLRHRNLIFHDSTVLDVGANVGNHSIFYAACTAASRVYSFEPNPPAIALLRRSIGLNDLADKCDLSYLNMAVGEFESEIYVAGEYENNLGATFFNAVAYTEDAKKVPCVPLDNLSFIGKISFIKIDVEGMEIEVLKGAQSLLEHHRPSIAVEINERNEKLFWEWVKRADYHVIDLFYESIGVRNYILIPIRPK
jgi:FkbM family methyltransferase